MTTKATIYILIIVAVLIGLLSFLLKTKSNPVDVVGDAEVLQSLGESAPTSSPKVSSTTTAAVLQVMSQKATSTPKKVPAEKDVLKTLGE